MPFLFLLFVLVPIVEIALFIQVGGAIGLLPTLVIVIATALLGTFMLRREGLATLTRARARLSSGALPAAEIIEGALLLVGGALLLTPGFMTDAFGFACLLPPSRRWLARRIGDGALGRVGVVRSAHGVDPMSDARPGSESGFGGAATNRADPRKRAGDVIDGDYERLD